LNQLFPEFIEEYLNDLTFKGRKESTIKRYIYDLNDFSYWLQKHRATTNDINWKSITKEELNLFFVHLIEDRKYNVKTVRRIHSVLRQLASYRSYLGSSELHPIKEIEAPELTFQILHESEWISAQERSILLETASSTVGLSDQQKETFPFYKERNEFIIRLFLNYGLNLHEVHELSMNHIKFERNQIEINQEKNSRIITLQESDKKLAYHYFKKIPEPVRPRYYSDDPFFVAFDFKRKTFHWSYTFDQPKRMSMIAIQKMLRQEVSRSNLRKGISAQTLRNTFILSSLLETHSPEDLIKSIGYTTPLSVKRYLSTVDSLSKIQIEQLTLSGA